MKPQISPAKNKAGIKTRPDKRPVKLPTPSRLANIALHYLSKYAASEASLRRVLQNRIRRASMRDPAFAADAEKHAQLKTAIETIIETHKKTGAINDAAYAETKANALRRSGKSRRAIEQKLGGKGVARNLITAALDESDGLNDDIGPDAEPNTARHADLKAAIRLAQKRRLGPYRNPLTTSKITDEARHKREVATMARAGFSFDIIKKVLSADGDGDSLDAIISGAFDPYN
jgi:regulatory protein